MWELDVKKAEHRKIDAFELWCWRRLLRVPWTAKRSNQSILKEISPGCFLENDAKAETPVLWPPHAKSWLIGKTLMLGGIGGRRRRRRQRMRWLNGITDSRRWVWVNSGSWWCQPTISSSVIPFSSHLQSFPASGSFQMSQLFSSGGQRLEF